MVNSQNRNKVKGMVVQSFLLLLLFMISSGVYGKKIQSYFTTLVQEDGTLYHIYPLYEYSSLKDKVLIVLDFTYKTSLDSVTMNYTLTGKNPIQIKSILLETSENDSLTLTSGRLFIDKKKKDWRSRYSSKISKTQFLDIINSNDVFNIIVEHENQKLLFELNGKKWNKQRDIIRQVFSIVSLNN